MGRVGQFAGRSARCGKPGPSAYRQRHYPEHLFEPGRHAGDTRETTLTPVADLPDAAVVLVLSQDEPNLAENALIAATERLIRRTRPGNCCHPQPSESGSSLM
jgi:hypothetical protein